MDRSTRGRKAREKGRLIEYVALVHLMLKGYRILGFRLKIPQGEIDILAQKGNRLAVVEVKSRTAHDIALESVSIVQQERLWQAGMAVQARKGQLAKLDLSVDLYTFAPGKWPRHILNAFEQTRRF